MTVSERLRGVVSRCLGPAAVTGIVEPTLADIHAERSSLLARARGYAGLAAALALYATDAFAGHCRQSTPAERAAFAKAALIGSLSGIAIVLLLTGVYIPIVIAYTQPAVVFYASPSAIPLALPFGIILGVFAIRRQFTPWLRTMTMGVALAASIASFVALGWIIPATNQMFREHIFAARVSNVAQAPKPARGVREMTLGELWDAGRQMQPVPPPGISREYHERLAIAPMTLVFALFAVAMLRVTKRGSAVVLGALVVMVGWYTLRGLGNASARVGQVSPVLAAWGPNLAVLLVTSLLWAISRRRASTTTS